MIRKKIPQNWNSWAPENKIFSMSARVIIYISSTYGKVSISRLSHLLHMHSKKRKSKNPVMVERFVPEVLDAHSAGKGFCWALQGMRLLGVGQ